MTAHLMPERGHSRKYGGRRRMVQSRRVLHVPAAACAGPADTAGGRTACVPRPGATRSRFRQGPESGLSDAAGKIAAAAPDAP